MTRLLFAALLLFTASAQASVTIENQYNPESAGQRDLIVDIRDEDLPSTAAQSAGLSQRSESVRVSFQGVITTPDDRPQNAWLYWSIGKTTEGELVTAWLTESSLFPTEWTPGMIMIPTFPANWTHGRIFQPVRFDDHPDRRAIPRFRQRDGRIIFDQHYEMIGNFTAANQYLERIYKTLLKGALPYPYHEFGHPAHLGTATLVPKHVARAGLIRSEVARVYGTGNGLAQLNFKMRPTGGNGGFHSLVKGYASEVYPGGGHVHADDQLEVEHEQGRGTFSLYLPDGSVGNIVDCRGYVM